MPAKFLQRFRYFYKTLLFWILMGILTGIITGIIMVSVGRYSPRVKMLVKFPGDIFIRMLKCVAVPLLAACLTVAIGGLDRTISLRIAGQFVACWMVLKLESALFGFLATYPFQNIRHMIRKNKTKTIGKAKLFHMPVDNYLDMVRNMFCRNIFEMFIYTYVTKLEQPDNKTKDISDWNIKGEMSTSPNMMGIIVVSVCAGLAISYSGKPGEPLLYIMQSVTKLFFVLMKWVIVVSPVLLVFLMAGAIIATDNIVELFEDAGIYVLAFLLLYPVQFFLLYPLLYFLATRNNPYKLMSAKVILTAFSTSSSLATLPLAIEYFEEVHHYDSRLVRFVLSVGVNVCKEGATLFYSFGSHIASFLNEIDMGIVQILQLFILAMAGSIGTPGVPFGAMAVLWIVWMALGFDDEADFYGTVFSMEWLRDRISTVVNLYGNCFILGILYHYNKKYFENLPEITAGEEEELPAEKPST